MPNDGHRYELVDGVLLVSPSPRPLHQRAVARLLAALTPGCPRAYEVLPAPVDVVLAEDTVFIPDVLVGQRSRFSNRGLDGAPLLAVEVFSPSTRLVDMRLKRARLEQAGCPFYWMVDPDEPRLICLELRAGEYREAGVSVGDDILELDEPFPVRLSAQSLVVEFRDGSA